MDHLVTVAQLLRHYAKGPRVVLSFLGARERALVLLDGAELGRRLRFDLHQKVLCGFLGVQLIDLLDSPIQSHGLKLTVGVVSICVVFALQVYISSSGSETWSMRPLRSA